MNSRKILLLAAVIVWFCGPVWGQEGKVDSLEQLFTSGEVSDTRKAEILLEISEVYKQSNPQLSREKAAHALQLLDKEGSPETYVKTLNTLGSLSIKLGDMQAARNHYDEAYRTAVRYPVSFDQKVEAIIGRGTVASYSGDSDSALELYNEGLSICDSLGLIEQKAALLNNKSLIFQQKGEFNQALNLQKAALHLKQQNNSNQTELGRSFLGIANTYGRMAQNDSAAVYVNYALTSFRDFGDQYGIASAFSTKGNIAQNLGELEQAVACFDSARAYYTRIGNEQQVAISGMQAGSVMNTMQLSDQAAKYLKESLAILEKGQNKRALLFAYQSYANALSGTIDGEEGASARKVRDTVILTNLKAAALANELGDRYNEGLTLSNLGLNYCRIEKYKEAVSALQKAIEIRKDQGLYNPYLTLGKCYLETGMPGQAQRALMISDSLASQIDGLTNTAEYYKELSLAYEKLGLYAESNKALFRYVDIRNQFYDENKAAVIAEIEERYQTEQKELQNQALQRENELQASINRNQRMGLGGLGLGLIALAGLSTFLYRQRQRIQAQKSQIELLHREQRHRMMNNLVFANSLMSLQVRRLGAQPEAQQAVKEAEGRLNAMSALHRRLHHDGEGQNKISIHGYLQEVTNALQRSFSSSKSPLKIHLHCPEGAQVDGDAAMRIGLIVNELATNSCKHAFAEQPDSRIDVHLEPQPDNRYRLIYTDNGSGLPADFQVDTKQSMGLFLIHNLVKQLNGRIAFSGEKGTRVECELNLKAA